MPVLPHHARGPVDDEAGMLGRQEALPALPYPDGTDLTGPRVHVLEQVAVDRLQVLEAEVAADGLQAQLHRADGTRGVLELAQLVAVRIGSADRVRSNPVSWSR